MKILSFDTCLDKMYVTLADDADIISSKIIETTQSHYHSAFLISTIKAILKENDLTPDYVDVISTNIGPGSFTGIRACTTVARIFAQSLNIKAIGVSSLEILSKINTTNKKTLVALDARKEMAYIAIFDRKTQILAPKAILLTELNELIQKDDYFVITDDKLKSILDGISYQSQNYNLGKYLVEITYEKLNTNAEYNWQNLLPLYIQPPPITIKKTK